MRHTEKIRDMKNFDYPNYSTAKECLEHFRFASILHRHTKMPTSYVEHIKSEIGRFETLKIEGNEKKKLINKTNVSKLDDLLGKVVKTNIHKKDFSIAISTKRTEHGTAIDHLLISKNKRNSYDILDTKTDDKLFYDINQYKLAYLLTITAIEGKNRKHIEVKQLLDNNNQYSHLLESLNENTKKLELLTTEKEKSTTETIINGLKDQVNILDQLISAQYVHKNNSLKA